MMGYNYTEEQRILQGTLRRFVAGQYSFEKRRLPSYGEPGSSRARWAQFADLGILAIPFAESLGGLQGTPVDVAVVMREFGRALVLEPFLSTVVLAGGVVRHAGSAAQQEMIIPQIIGGESIYAVAWAESGSRYNLADVSVTARKQGGSYILQGAKSTVSGAHDADWVCVSARTAGARRDRNGITLFRVRADAPGVLRHDYPTIDGGRAATVAFDSVRVESGEILGEVDAALGLIERVADEAVLALCAEGLGAIEALNDATIQYAKERVTFGQAISKFQVIRHRLVDMKLAAEQASALVLGAAGAVEPNAADRARLASAAKVKVGSVGRTVAHGAVQIHGGIGTTEELEVGHHLRRLMAIEALFGDTSYHLQRFTRLSRSEP